MLAYNRNHNRNHNLNTCKAVNDLQVQEASFDATVQAVKAAYMEALCGYGMTAPEAQYLWDAHVTKEEK